MKEIAETIRRAISMTDGTAKFCFFVDGIDEYSGDHSEMIRLLQDFSKMRNVKLCLSSRPWNIFEDAFGNASKTKFYLQELTRGDIKEYVRGELVRHPAWKSLAQPNNTQYKEIVAEVLERADSVFLWVFLVVNLLLEGLTNGDTMSLLQHRLRRIPSDLRDFFKYILESLDPIYNAHVAHFFIAALDTPEPLPLMMYSFFEDEFDNPTYAQELGMTALELYEIIPRHKQTERRLNGRCKGLLEVYRDPDGLDLFRYRVGFLHRTVRDFFKTDEMRREFEARIPEKLNTGLSIIKASIAMMKKTPRIGKRLGDDADFGYLVDTVMQNSRKAEMLNGAPTTRLLEELSYVLGQLRYLEEYWGGVGGLQQNMFLGLAIERGLLLYVSQQLRCLRSGPICTKQMQLGPTRRSLLDCAMGYPPFLSSAEPDVSDMVLFLLTHGCGLRREAVRSQNSSKASTAREVFRACQ
jgi:hypothetical protein